jgi:hypothetical protein
MFGKIKARRNAAILQKVNRIDAEDYLDQGYSCSEIADLMHPEVKDGTPLREMLVKKINNIKLNKQRRDAKNGVSQPIEETDSLTKAKQDLKAAEVQLKIMEIQERTEELREQMGSDDDSADPDNPMETMIMSYLTSQMQQQQQPQAAQVAQIQQTQQQQTISYTDEEITAILEQYKPQLKAFQKLPDSVIIKTIGSYFPQVDDDTKNRALALIKKRELC